MTDPIRVPGWGPGLHQNLKLNGIDQLTFGKLEKFIHQAQEQHVPTGAVVELHTEIAERPGERSSWSIAVSWQVEP